MSAITGMQGYSDLVNDLELLEEEYDEHFEPTENG